jgi:CRP/FNR family transcriptional regulator
MLIQGQVTLSVNSSDGKRLIIGIAKAGEVLGLASVLSGSSYEIAAEAHYACTVSIINRVEFLRFLLRHISAFRAATLCVCRSYNQACTRFRTLSGSPSSKAKIARLLIEFSKSGSEAGGQFHLALNHREIGEWVGMSRESVSRVFGAFRRDELITQDGVRLVIKDRSSLEKLAAACKSDWRDESDEPAYYLRTDDDEHLIHPDAVLQPGKSILSRSGIAKTRPVDHPETTAIRVNSLLRRGASPLPWSLPKETWARVLPVNVRPLPRNRS